jgi:hypothetical protein
MIEQFSVCSYGDYLVVILTNTVFNEVESLLVAPIKPTNDMQLIKHLQVGCKISGNEMHIDLLDIATVSKSRLKPFHDLTLLNLRQEIKAGIDLLIDGF